MSYIFSGRDTIATPRSTPAQTPRASDKSIATAPTTAYARSALQYLDNHQGFIDLVPRGRSSKLLRQLQHLANPDGNTHLQKRLQQLGLQNVQITREESTESGISNYTLTCTKIASGETYSVPVTVIEGVEDSGKSRENRTEEAVQTRTDTQLATMKAGMNAHLLRIHPDYRKAGQMPVITQCYKWTNWAAIHVLQEELTSRVLCRKITAKADLLIHFKDVCGTLKTHTEEALFSKPEHLEEKRIFKYLEKQLPSSRQTGPHIFPDSIRIDKRSRGNTHQSAQPPAKKTTTKAEKTRQRIAMQFRPAHHSTPVPRHKTCLHRKTLLPRLPLQGKNRKACRTLQIIHGPSPAYPTIVPKRPLMLSFKQKPLMPGQLSKARCAALLIQGVKATKRRLASFWKEWQLKIRMPADFIIPK
ncbi:MAG: hypothetical protein HC848_05735 [Limnobacter sp.]|nr:hypothetical protein [Limnobacter sp.]